jgi:hypothetical protein
MSDQIAAHYAIQFAQSIELLLQQKGSVLSDTVRNEHKVGKAASIVDQIGKSEAQKRTGRYPPITPREQPTDRPWVYPSDYDWDDLIDSIDKLRMLTDPQSAYVQNGTNAMGRAKDREIIAAFFGDRKTGEQGATTTSFPAANQVAVNFGATGNVGLTVAKLREARRLLMSFEALNDPSDTATCVIKAKQHDNLLAEIQVINKDYTDTPVMKEGNVDRFMGFNFRRTELVGADGSGYDRVACYVKSGMVLATWNDITTDVSQRKDLAGLPIQIYVYGTFGATRTQENKVIEIKCA